MKDLSGFVKNEFIKKALFEESLFVNTEVDVERALATVNYGKYINIVFKNSNLKEMFIDQLLTIRSDANIINVNCSLNKFNELNINNLRGLLVFNNVKHCKYSEILESIKSYKGILLC